MVAENNGVRDGCRTQWYKRCVVGDLLAYFKGHFYYSPLIELGYHWLSARHHQ